MPMQTINTGTAPNDGTGDAIRDAFIKVNGNFTQVLPLEGGALTGALVLSGDPVAALGAATKQYVDSVASGLDPKGAVRAATTATITLSGLQTIDGVALSTGDRVLVKNQSTASQNGIYAAASSAWGRAADADSSVEVTPGLYTIVTEGIVNGKKGFVLTTAGPITLGATALTFELFTDASGAIDEAKKTTRAQLAAKTVNYTLAADDAGRDTQGSHATGITFTFDGATQIYAAGLAGTVTQIGAGKITIAGAGGVTLRKAAKFKDFSGAVKTAEQESVAGWKFDSATVVRLWGDLELA